MQKQLCALFSENEMHPFICTKSLLRVGVHKFSLDS